MTVSCQVLVWKRLIANDDTQKAMAEKEKDKVAMLQHQHIVRYEGFMEVTNTFYIIMESCQTDLQLFINDRNGMWVNRQWFLRRLFSNEDVLIEENIHHCCTEHRFTLGFDRFRLINHQLILKIMAQLTSALKEWHRHRHQTFGGVHRNELRVLHRDIKPGNVFLDSVLKAADQQTYSV